jgi:hypothetical protein
MTVMEEIASWSLSSGAHSRDPLGRNDTSYFFSSGQREASRDWNASLPGTVPSSL